MRVLYAGDSPVGGAANYLLGVLGSMRARVTHVPPSVNLSSQDFSARYDVVLFSDYSASRCSHQVQLKLETAVYQGTGFGMIGGWGSYSGPFGGWHGSVIEGLLPVRCLPSDDRMNFPGGAAFVVKKKHEILGVFSAHDLPVICGINQVLPGPEASVVLAVRRIIHGKKLRLERKEYPLLVVSKNRKMRTAAFATDFAPHWCGGMVDWGQKTLTLPVQRDIRIQVGNRYVDFIASFVRWLASKSE